MQNRNPWVTDEVLKDPDRMPMQRFVQLWRIASRRRRDEVRDRMRGHAWTAWWVYRTMELAPPSSHMSWEEWISAMGLRDEDFVPRFASLAEEIAAINARVEAACKGVRFKEVEKPKQLSARDYAKIPRAQRPTREEFARARIRPA